MTMGGVSLV